MFLAFALSCIGMPNDVKAATFITAQREVLRTRKIDFFAVDTVVHVQVQENILSLTTS
jgi:hypothetical protein